MQLFEDLIKCKDCMNNLNSKCILYPRKDDNKSIIKKSYAFKIKNNGDTSYNYKNKTENF